MRMMTNMTVNIGKTNRRAVMIELPIGKALIAVKVKDNACKGCYFNPNDNFINCRGITYKHRKGKRVINEVVEVLACGSHRRKDGKNVIFKLVAYKGKQ